MNASDQAPVRPANGWMGWLLLLAVLVAFVGFGISALTYRTNCTELGEASADIRNLETNVIRYRLKAGVLPSQVQGLEALVKKPESDPAPKNWRQLMDTSALTDPWGHPYQYRNPGNKHRESFDVYSLGPDGQDGTGDDVFDPNPS